MRSTFILSSLLLCFLFFISSCKQSKTEVQENKVAMIIDSLELHLKQVSDSTIIPGFSVAVVRKDSLLFNKGFGYSDLAAKTPFTEHTAHTIASISKTFIGIAIMQLVERGALSLDQEINSILPFEINNPHYPNVPIRVKHLVTHSSGINDNFDDGDKRASWLVEPLPADYANLHPDTKEDIDYFDGEKTSLQDYLISFCTPKGRWYHKDNFSNFEPGIRYEYSNGGAVVAAYIVALVSGMSYAEYTKKHIFEPLKMSETSWFYNSLALSYSKLYVAKGGKLNEFPRYHEASYPDGQLKTTTSDLSVYLLEMMRGKKGKGMLLNNASYQRLFSSQLPRTAFDEVSKDKLYDEYDVGIFWAVSEPGYILHAGGMMGVYSIIYFNPETDIGMLAICNVPDPSFGQILEALEKCEKSLETLDETKG